jgi:hypothetical protein
VDLRLDNPAIAIQFPGYRLGLLGGMGYTPVRHWNAIAAEQFFSLIFMYVHVLSSCKKSSLPG